MESTESKKSTDFIIQNNQQNIKLYLFNKKTAYLYIQNNLDDKRFRIATNYKVLNKIFNLKIDIKRNIKIETLMKLNDFIKTHNYIKDSFELNYNNQSLNIEKYFNEDETHSIMIITKTHEKEKHISIFHGCENYNTLEEIFQSKGDYNETNT